MGQDMRDNGKMIFSMEKELRLGPMVHAMRVITLQERSMALVGSKNNS
jgi:hypothetical protein